MTVAEVMRAAMALTPNERAQVADMLYGIDDADPREIDAAWASLFARRANDLESGAVPALTHEEADAYLDARAAARAV